MVYYFTSDVVAPPVTLFMGFDKHESEWKWKGRSLDELLYKFSIPDEDLIKYGFPEDVWFHVDKVSSAHVYLRLQPVRSGYV